MNYKLNIDISPTDLEAISGANERIVIAKPVTGNTPNVAWVAFDPFQSNKITWEPSYVIYTSATSSTDGQITTRGLEDGSESESP